MSKGKILVVGSNATRIEIQGGTTGPMGQYLNETVVPVQALIAAGYDVVLATPSGTKPVIDIVSDVAEDFGGDIDAWQRGRDFYANDPAMNNVKTLRAVIDGGLDQYAGMFVPGGQAPVVDLMQNDEVREILTHFHTNRKPTAMLCHGPIVTMAALPDAKAYRRALVAGDKAKIAELGKNWLYAGYKMTVFSASEEVPIEKNFLHGKLYFNMPDALSGAGGVVSKGNLDFAPYVVEDRELITGQNPASDKPIAAKFIAALDRAV